MALFIDGNFSELDKTIPRINKNKKELISASIASDFVYSYKEHGLFLFVLNVAIILAVMLFLYALNFLIFAFPLLIYCLFLIRLRHNHIQHSKHRSIRISLGSPDILLSHNEQITKFTKDDIKIIRQYANQNGRSAFAEYNYSTIILHDGRIFDLSYMIIQPFVFNYKVPKVPREDIRKYYPFIPNRNL
jgi:hypothetical protein